jgi:hypothetical protein
LAKGAVAISMIRKPRFSNWSFISAAFALSGTTTTPASSGRCGCRYIIVRLIGECFSCTPANRMHQVYRTQQIRNLPSQGFPLGACPGAIPSKYRAACSRRLLEFVERATIAFDDAVANLFQGDILQNNGAAVSTFKRQSPPRTKRLSACDL